MFNIPKKYNWRLQKTQDYKKKDTYHFNLLNKKQKVIKCITTRSIKAMANKIKKLNKIL